ncbi:MAG: hypothetical protein U9R25_14960 [Chloroflexota bacterium]|nr:hypothetical protein [Chloroflexota bacterium]
MKQLNEREIHQHVRILGWLYMISSAFLVLFGIAALMFMAGIGAASGDPEAFRILSVVGLVAGALMIVLGMPGIVAGYGLLRRKAWARILAMIVGFLSLANFPVGSAIGLYTFFVLMQESATDYFATPDLKPMVPSTPATV